MTAKPKTIDEYLDTVGDHNRVVLEKLRKTIRAAAPKAEEYISYGLAAFRLNGKPLVAFGASANHCSFFPMDSTTVAAHKAELKGYDTSKGTIRFQAKKPLPVSLVRKLVKARIAANSAIKTKPVAKPETGPMQSDPEVVAYLRELKHPLKNAIEAVRQIILGVSLEIHEGIKWNSPSFRTSDWFATLNLRASDGKDRVWLILHSGAKLKAGAALQSKIADPKGLLKWLAKDRCLVTFESAKDVEKKRAPLVSVLQEWIKLIPG